MCATFLNITICVVIKWQKAQKIAKNNNLLRVKNVLRFESIIMLTFGFPFSI